MKFLADGLQPEGERRRGYTGVALPMFAASRFSSLWPRSEFNSVSYIVTYFMDHVVKRYRD